MKLFVIYSNCHSNPIEFFLNLSEEFKNTYRCHIVNILNYLNKPEITQLRSIDVENLNKADVVLCQYIQNDRNHLNHVNVLSYCKSDAKILMIPHHRFFIYSIVAKNEFKFKVNNWTFIPIEIYEHYEKNKKYEDFELGFNDVLKSIKIKMDDKEIDRLIKCYINHYTNLNETQSSRELNMTTYVTENYKSIQLFSDDAHPSGIFFYELVKKILNVLNIHDIKKYDPNNDYTTLENSIWLQTYVPISDQEKEKIGLNFNCFMPNVVMLSTSTRKKAKSLCEYYFLHIENALTNNQNQT